MEWLSDNWIWLLLGGGMIGMHYFGHGRRGAGGGCCGGHAHGHDEAAKADGAGAPPKAPLSGERDVAR